MNLTIIGLTPLLTATEPPHRRSFALACVRHALAALPTDPRRVALAALLDLPEVDRLARWQAVNRHAWSTGSFGPARRALWGAAYWAVYPAEPFSCFAAEQAAWYSQWAVAERAVETTAPVSRPFQTAAAAEAVWQHSALTTLLSYASCGPSAPRLGGDL